MKVLKNFIAIKPDVVKDKHGLTLAGSDRETLERAKVIGVGPEVEDIKKGDVVLYKNFNLSSVEVDKDKYIFVSADDVMAIL